MYSSLECEMTHVSTTASALSHLAKRHTGRNIAMALLASIVLLILLVIAMPGSETPARSKLPSPDHSVTPPARSDAAPATSSLPQPKPTETLPAYTTIEPYETMAPSLRPAQQGRLYIERSVGEAGQQDGAGLTRAQEDIRLRWYEATTLLQPD
jgi:hypothetical protein